MLRKITSEPTTKSKLLSYDRDNCSSSFINNSNSNSTKTNTRGSFTFQDRKSSLNFDDGKNNFTMSDTNSSMTSTINCRTSSLKERTNSLTLGETAASLAAKSKNSLANALTYRTDSSAMALTHRTDSINDDKSSFFDWKQRDNSLESSSRASSMERGRRKSSLGTVESNLSRDIISLV